MGVCGGGGSGELLTSVDIREIGGEFGGALSGYPRTGADIPVTFGVLLEEGKVTGPNLSPALSGQHLPAQVDVRATHSDGSVRHALISTKLPSVTQDGVIRIDVHAQRPDDPPAFTINGVTVDDLVTDVFMPGMGVAMDREHVMSNASGSKSDFVGVIPNLTITPNSVSGSYEVEFSPYGSSNRTTHTFTDDGVGGITGADIDPALPATIDYATGDLVFSSVDADAAGDRRFSGDYGARYTFRDDWRSPFTRQNAGSFISDALNNQGNWLAGAIRQSSFFWVPLSAVTGAARAHRWMFCRVGLHLFAQWPGAFVEWHVENCQLTQNSPQKNEEWFLFGRQDMDRVDFTLAGQVVRQVTAELVKRGNPGDPFVHFDKTRYRLGEWVGQKPPQLSFQQDYQYLAETTQFFPAYDWESGASDGDQNNEANNQIGDRVEPDRFLFGMPMSSGMALPNMGNTGDRADIGPLPRWDVLGANSAAGPNARIWAVCLATGGNGHGAYTWCMRVPPDEARPQYVAYAGQPGAPPGYPGVTGGGDNAPFDSNRPNDSNANPDQAHVPQFAYWLYAITGELWYEDVLSMLACWAGNQQPDGSIDRGGRGGAWNVRNVGEAAFLLSDSHPLKAAYDTQGHAIIDRWIAELAGGEKFSPDFAIQSDKITSSGRVDTVVHYVASPWTHGWWAWGVYHLWKLTGYTPARTLFDFAAKWFVAVLSPPENGHHSVPWDFLAPDGVTQVRWTQRYFVSYTFSLRVYHPALTRVSGGETGLVTHSNDPTNRWLSNLGEMLWYYGVGFDRRWNGSKRFSLLGEYVTDENATGEEFDGTLVLQTGADGVLPCSVDGHYFDGAADQSFSDDGQGNLTGTDISGTATIDYNTGQIQFSSAAGTPQDVWVFYRTAWDDAANGGSQRLFKGYGIPPTPTTRGTGISPVNGITLGHRYIAGATDENATGEDFDTTLDFTGGTQVAANTIYIRYVSGGRTWYASALGGENDDTAVTIVGPDITGAAQVSLQTSVLQFSSVAGTPSNVDIFYGVLDWNDPAADPTAWRPHRQLDVSYPNCNDETFVPPEPQGWEAYGGEEAVSLIDLIGLPGGADAWNWLKPYIRNDTNPPAFRMRGQTPA